MRLKSDLTNLSGGATDCGSMSCPLWDGRSAPMEDEEPSESAALSEKTSLQTVVVRAQRCRPSPAIGVVNLFLKAYRVLASAEWLRSWSTQIGEADANSGARRALRLLGVGERIATPQSRICET